MNKIVIVLLLCLQYLLTSCTAIKTSVNNQYTLDTYSNRQLTPNFSKQSILVTLPEAAAGYQTEQMLYMKKPYELSAFSQNAWVDPPANMLLPLIVQSLQYSHYFYVVASGPHTENTDYRLDSQLIELQQNFLTKPSMVNLIMNAVLTRVSDNHVIASRLFSVHVKCRTDSPYGGVLAANAATEQLTAELTQFVATHTRA